MSKRIVLAEELLAHGHFIIPNPLALLSNHLHSSNRKPKIPQLLPPATGEHHNVAMSSAGTNDDIGQVAKPSYATKSRWITVLLTGLIMFGNHYARDALGALEIQIETDLKITTDQYAAINSFYFIPSIFAPLLAGALTNYLGGPEVCLLYACISGATGHVIFSVGIQSDSIRMIYIGRSIAGNQ